MSELSCESMPHEELTEKFTFYHYGNPLTITDAIKKRLLKYGYKEESVVDIDIWDRRKQMQRYFEVQVFVLLDPE